ncbi:MAG: SH3 domain-containing protein, partial [Chloroflexota bacterium]
MHLSNIRRHGRESWLAWTLVLVLFGHLVSSAAVAQAQSDPFPVGTVVSVANTDGQRLNLRAGASTADAIVGRLQPGTTLTVTGPSKVTGGMRWLPVRTGNGVNGWVSDKFVIVSSPPAPTPTRTAERTPTPEPA